MNLLRNIIVAGVVVAMFIGGSYLYAQPEEEEESAEVKVPMEKKAQLSPKEMTKRSEEMITEMKGMLKRVLKLQQVARKQKDIIKLNCVNDKLLQLKQLLNIAEAARNNLTEAITVKNEGDRYHQFGQITISHEKATVLRDEAEGCIGEELIFLGPTEVDVDKPDIDDDPTDDNPFDFNDPDIERPGYASPFL